jgi:hypothetical protein
MTPESTVKPDPPAGAELAGLLGPAAGLWTLLQERIRSGHAPVTERWVYGGRKYGWSCRVERGKKGILYMTPDAGHFRVGLALSDAGREAALASDLPGEIRESLTGAARAIEGWPVRMHVRTADDVAAVLALAEIKRST